MTEKEIKNTINYWATTANHDHDTMLALFKSKRYSDSLFFGHIVIEKLLKGLVVRMTGEQAPFTHDLVRLAQLAELDLNKKEVEFLNKINEFNIRARYPEYKLSFYKKCTREYTEKYIVQIENIYKNLCQKIK